MAFAVRTLRLPKGAVQPHPNADRLEIVQVGGYQSCVQKGAFHDGDLIAYIPEQARLPEEVILRLGLVGKLGGPGSNVVSAVRLRGVLSQGICYPAASHPGWTEGLDVTEELGITKFLTPIPQELLGAVWAPGKDRTLKYDIRNIQEFPNVLQPGEEVVFTEKIHGTLLEVGFLPKGEEDPVEGDFIVTSKGLAQDGLAFQINAPENKNNPYVAAVRDHLLRPMLGMTFHREIAKGWSVFVLGEVYGSASRQDLKYGCDGLDRGKYHGPQTSGFAVFDVALKRGGDVRYLSEDEIEFLTEDKPNAKYMFRHRRVPVLYRGPFSMDKVREFTEGQETISGLSLHTREGIVITPVVERTDPILGRVKLKSKSAAYLLRSGGTELE